MAGNENDQGTVPYNLRARVERLELVVAILARGILSHEYAKDLHRDGVEDALKALADDGDIKAAISAVGR